MTQKKEIAPTTHSQSIPSAFNMPILAVEMTNVLSNKYKKISVYNKKSTEVGPLHKDLQLKMEDIQCFQKKVHAVHHSHEASHILRQYPKYRVLLTFRVVSNLIYYNNTRRVFTYLYFLCMETFFLFKYKNTGTALSILDPRFHVIFSFNQSCIQYTMQKHCGIKNLGIFPSVSIIYLPLYPKFQSDSIFTSDSDLNRSKKRKREEGKNLFFEKCTLSWVFGFAFNLA